jgi:hypothetical protein
MLRASTNRGAQMTTFDALVSMSQMMLRARGEWQQGATSFLAIELAANQMAIELAANQIADLMRDGDPDLVPKSMLVAAIRELKRRATPAVA